MRKNAHAIEILLAGPSDVKRELQVARDVIEAWNAAHSHTENTLLQAVYWDTHAFPEIGDRPQGVINRQLVDRCDLLIAVFWKSIGSPTGVAPSGTIESPTMPIRSKLTKCENIKSPLTMGCIGFSNRLLSFDSN